MDPRYEKFVKKATSRKRSMITDDDMFSPKKPEETYVYEGDSEEPKSFFKIFRDCGSEKWLQQDNTAARASFNVFNLALHPDREMAGGLAIVPLKGTTFPDKRQACLDEAIALAANESTGEVELRPEPTNPYDSNALGVYSLLSGAHLGYIPKAAEANHHYIQAMKAGRLTGAYIIEAKQSLFKGEPSAMLMLATGWKKPENS